LEAAYRNCLNNQGSSGSSGSRVPSYSAPSGGGIPGAFDNLRNTLEGIAREREERERANQLREEQQRQQRERGKSKSATSYHVHRPNSRA